MGATSLIYHELTGGFCVLNETKSESEKEDRMFSVQVNYLFKDAFGLDKLIIFIPEFMLVCQQHCYSCWINFLKTGFQRASESGFEAVIHDTETDVISSPEIADDMGEWFDQNSFAFKR